MSTPPTITPETQLVSIQIDAVNVILRWHLPTISPMQVPSASNCSAIWNANSRVGVTTSANNRLGESKRDCRMGNANAPVFPDLKQHVERMDHRQFVSRPVTYPVSASAMMSFPVSATGMVSCWIFVGFCHPNLWHASESTSVRP